MDRLYVDLGKNSYDIVFSETFDFLTDELKKINAPKKLLIVTDSNVEKIWLGDVFKRLTNDGYDVFCSVIKAGEENKNIEQVLKICSDAKAHNMDRRSMILALGGGVVGDIAGFAASMYMRGIRFVQLPTTLLSQSDSSVGGKTGVDFEGAKNIIGAFFQPSLVYINISTLKTLPKEEILSGLGEVIKHGIIRDKEFFDYLFENADKIKALDNFALIKMARTNCKIKVGVVSLDEKENSLRAILNFGHTIGHAVESAACFKKTHGLCVAIGMKAASFIAKKRNLIDEADFQKIIKIIELYGFDTKVTEEKEQILLFMKNDKKSENGKIKFILPTGLGEVGIFSDISEKEISSAIDFLN